MKRFSTYMLVAAMATCSAGFAVAADTDNTGVNNTGAQMQQLGGQQADQATQKEARTMLSKVINDAVTQNKFDNLIGYLAKADKDRLADMKSAKTDDLNTVVNQFRTDFKNKYNQDFEIQPDHLNNAMVFAGQDKKSATVTLAKTDLSVSSNNPAYTTDQSTAVNNNKPAPGMTDGAPADRTLNTGPDQVTVSNRSGAMSGAAADGSTSGKSTGPASSGSNGNSTVHGNDTTANPGVQTINNGMATDTTTPPANATINGALASAGGASVSLINEGHIMNAWRINIPDQISGEQLKQNLIKHIQMLDDQKATWPSDVNAAYRATACHVLQAFSDSSLASER